MAVLNLLGTAALWQAVFLIGEVRHHPLLACTSSGCKKVIEQRVYEYSSVTRSTKDKLS